MISFCSQMIRFPDIFLHQYLQATGDPINYIFLMENGFSFFRLQFSIFLSKNLRSKIANGIGYEIKSMKPYSIAQSTNCEGEKKELIFPLKHIVQQKSHHFIFILYIITYKRKQIKRLITIFRLLLFHAYQFSALFYLVRTPISIILSFYLFPVVSAMIVNSIL